MHDVVGAQEHVALAVWVGAGQGAFEHVHQVAQRGLHHRFAVFFNDARWGENAVADEVRHEARGRAVVKRIGVVPLVQVALVHDANGVANGEGFELVVGHEERCGASGFEDVAQLVREALAQVNVEVGERLIEQQQLRLGRHRSGQRHALLLATAELMRVTRLGAFQADKRQHLGHTGAALGFGQMVDAKADVVAHVQVREQRVVLKHHADPALLRRQVDTGAADDLVRDFDAASGGGLQPSNGAQQGGFAAAGRPDQHANVTGAQAEGNVMHGGLGALWVLHFELVDGEKHGLNFRGEAKSNAYNSHLQTTHCMVQRHVRQISRHLSHHILMALLAAGLLLPVLAVLAAWLPIGPQAGVAYQVLGEMAQTVLPSYVLTTIALCLAVGLGVAVLGVSVAAAVTLFDFPGRKFFEWALLLPLAMPAYVVAYAYTDFLQFSGPAQTALRDTFGLQGRVLPEVRSLGGAILVFIFVLYPYVYLLARTALAERAAHLMEAARLLGAPLGRRLMKVALPMARPAVAAGMALALMETLADFGVASYFGIQTFTAGIYKAWLAMDNRIAAAQLATFLLVLVALLLWLENRAQSRMRFAAAQGGANSAESRLPVLAGKERWAVTALCALPVLLGFVLPLVFMLRPLLGHGADLPWARFAGWAFNSLRLGALTAVLAVALALALAFSVRRGADFFNRAAIQLVGLGYAIPGAVVVVGLLLPVGWLQAVYPESGVGLVVTATSLGLVWAYLVRFCAVALQSVQSGYARIPTSFDDSARMLGTGDLRLAFRVHWPLLKRSTAAAGLLVFVDVMKELPATMVLRPFNSDTLAVVAYQLARDERLGEAALPSLALVLVGLLPVILLSRTLRATRVKRQR